MLLQEVESLCDSECVVSDGPESDESIISESDSYNECPLTEDTLFKHFTAT